MFALKVLKLSKLSLNPYKIKQHFSIIKINSIHLTSKCNDLMEFFDEKENWGENQVKTGLFHSIVEYF